MAMTDEEKATVNKRLLIGLGLTAAFCAAALVPDKQTRSKPSKPCFFYLVPLLRIKALLPELEATVASADTAKLRSGVAIVL
jgi:A/G-specific adenine glycosylase